MRQSFKQRCEERNAATKSAKLLKDYSRLSTEPYSNVLPVPLPIISIESYDVGHMPMPQQI